MIRSVRIVAILAILAGSTHIPLQLSAAGGQDLSDRTPRAPGGGSAESNDVYIVQMIDPAVVAYRGGIGGLRPTKPERGEKIHPGSPDVQAYSGYLESRQDRVLGLVGGGRKLHTYRHTFNGFAAELTLDQAQALRGQPDVVNVTKDELRFADTATTPHFLGLDDPDSGLWQKVGGVEGAGEGVIIGVVDSGVWPESPSFSDRAGRKANGNQQSYVPLERWEGTCQTGESFTESNCNQKLIGARYYNAGFGGNEGLKATRPWEFASPRDFNGHGTHTASTAGGNHGVRATGQAAIFGAISGIAPRARIAAYKALWASSEGNATGFSSDLVAAIDQAVADGVDVINLSVSGTTANFLDPVEVAFLFAADAGVFVAASAGNGGPATGTVAHPSPWITTVGAGTHDRSGEGAVTLGNRVVYTGASLAMPVGPAPLIDAIAAGAPGANATAISLCFAAADNGGTPVLDPLKVSGRIVVCDRGVNPLVNKSLAVLQAGGVGMILVNTSENSLNPELHYVPTVHLAHTDRAAVKAYAAGGGTARIRKATITFTSPAPLTAGFSSRGPLAAGGGDLLKPDVVAPGQSILAAVAPPGNGGRSFSVLSGTSMSSPHVAGLGALLKHLHPDWSPMMIKSALMTTGGDLLDGTSTSAAAIFRQGAGHVAPNKAADPGLVFDSGLNDWLAFLCGSTNGINPSTCDGLNAAGYSFDPSDLNLASIAIRDLPGVQTITRSVTNVGSGRATYTVSHTGMDGFDVRVTPRVLRVGAGKTRSVTVTIMRTDAPANVYTGGQLQWSDGEHAVRVPMVVRPGLLAAPSSVSGSGDPFAYNVTFGYNGSFAATPRGLVPASTSTGQVDDDPSDAFEPQGPGTVSFDVAIPAGTTYARFSLFDSDVAPASDLDLYVYRGTTLVGIGGTGTSTEEVNLPNPVAGAYTVFVHGFGVPAGGATFTLFNWLLPDADAGNMGVTAPTAASIGATGTISLTFDSNLEPGRYLGAVAYSGTDLVANPTIVRVDKP